MCREFRGWTVGSTVGQPRHEGVGRPAYGHTGAGRCRQADLMHGWDSWTHLVMARGPGVLEGIEKACVFLRACLGCPKE